jgi:dTDP-4-dehydrorhamnose reductase
MRKFEFKKAYEEIEIGGKVYKIDFSDDKVKEYAETFKKFSNEYKELLATDESKMDDDQALDHFEQIQDLVRRIFDTITGRGSYDELYEAAGRSITNMFELVKYIQEIVVEKQQKLQADKSVEYLKKKQQVRKK